jgi:acetoin utilization deacetylase AcuC-like enzyme
MVCWLLLPTFKPQPACLLTCLPRTLLSLPHLPLPADTFVNQHTAMCAKLSAGACVDVAAAVTRGEARAGVAVVRPPGHHAESNTAMGFCFFNNAGIAARAAQVGVWAGRRVCG